MGYTYAMSDMPLYYETGEQIFVHAEVDEEAGEYWKWGTNDCSGKYEAV